MSEWLAPTGSFFVLLHSGGHTSGRRFDDYTRAREWAEEQVVRLGSFYASIYWAMEEEYGYIHYTDVWHRNLNEKEVWRRLRSKGLGPL